MLTVNPIYSKACFHIQCNLHKPTIIGIGFEVIEIKDGCLRKNTRNDARVEFQNIYINKHFPRNKRIRFGVHIVVQ